MSGSGGYAARLSEYKNKGVVGLTERFDSSRVLESKLDRLHKLLVSSKSVVVLTGAGISTSAGIPDFRGPKGIWTLEEKAKAEKERAKRKKGSSSKADAKKQKTPAASDEPGSLVTVDTTDDSSTSPLPSTASATTIATTAATTPPPSDLFQVVPPTPTHMALAKLVQLNHIDYIITQNVDGLHLRSGVPRNKLSILHGDCFTEKCEKCGYEYFRDFDIGGVSFRKTGRTCEQPGCEGALRDTILDWEDELPEEDFGLAEDKCDEADLVLALGTSLRIIPAGQLPLRAKKFVVVNLQNTPYDDKAELVIAAKVDEVMNDLCSRLNVTL
ncbi:hypothetical protein TrVE_jg13121 [Triparma verrucosa]|uniref:protein acetyllysine N-acetyltransferase n=1 Tax=Triparma verrucosa TaxID=1606542 RepID=A0A9W7F8S9_9STRA|nr:hypothetical protein TrVE_jg13121 [Triparma verrucosa]